MTVQSRVIDPCRINYDENLSIFHFWPSSSQKSELIMHLCNQNRRSGCAKNSQWFIHDRRGSRAPSGVNRWGDIQGRRTQEGALHGCSLINGLSYWLYSIENLIWLVRANVPSFSSLADSRSDGTDFTATPLKRW
jgi:hypothetical protein